jgi:hypothetical protein
VLHHRMRLSAPVVFLIVLSACTASTTTSPTTAPTATEAADASAAPSASASAAPTSSTPETATLDMSWSVPFTMTAPAEWGEDPESSGESLQLKTGMDRWIVFSDTGPDTVEAWIEELSGTPQLVVTEPEAAEVGGAEGFVLDVSTSDEAPQVSGGSQCSSPCWALIEDAEFVWLVEEGRPSRAWIVDVDGETVMIVTDAPEGAFESWTATVGDALATLEWGD